MNKLIKQLAYKKYLGDDDDFTLDWCKKFNIFTLPSSKFHENLCEALNQLKNGHIKKLAICAPRGSAKSTFASCFYPIFRSKQLKYILIISDSLVQAKKLLASIKALVGRFAIKSSSTSIELANNCLIEASGSGCRIRGRRHNQYRPQLIIVDDPQSQIDVISEKERANSWDWFTREVIPAGSADAEFLVIGTSLHKECIIEKIAETGSSDWKFIRFPALLKEPTNLEVWNNWYNELINTKSEERHKVAGKYSTPDMIRCMEEGGESLWKERWSVFELMKIKYLSPQTFYSEYQQEPGFHPNSFFSKDLVDSIFLKENVDIMDCCKKRILVIDPSTGLRDKGDYQSIIVGGVVDDSKVYAVPFVFKVPDWIDRLIEYILKFKPEVVVVEENATMGLVKPHIELKIAQYEYFPHNFTLVGKYQRLNKELRIRSINNYIMDDVLRIVTLDRESSQILRRSFYEYPNVKNDDVLDALALFLESTFKYLI